MIENQWTYKIGQIEKYTDRVWQVGFYEKNDMTFVGVFDHLLKDDQHTVGLEDSGGFSDGSMEQIMLETVNVLVGHDCFIYGYVLPEQTDFWLRKPESVSLAIWLLSSRKKKFSMVVAKQTADDGIDLLASPDSKWFITVKFGKRTDLLSKYFARLGCNPDEKPDILYLSSKDIDSELKNSTQKKILGSIPLGNFSRLNTHEWDEWEKLTTAFHGILWAIDGHVYFVTKHDNKEELMEKIYHVAHKFGLRVASNHVLS